MYRITLLLALLWPFSGSSQALLYNDGAGITVENGAVVYVEGGITNTTGGTIDNDGSIQLEGDWVNEVSNGLTSSGNTGNVTFLGSAQQSIGGTQTTAFHNLTIDNATGVLLSLDASAGGTNGGGVLDLTSGYLDLNTHTLTITNGTTAGITAAANTYIKSETAPSAGYGIVTWNIATGTGAYIIPFGNGGANLYFTFNVVGAGTGTGTVSVNTYPTANDNTEYPTGVANMYGPSLMDASLNVTDRFWVVDLASYTANPVASLTIGYLDPENDPGNTITEGNLVAYQWDATNTYWLVNSTGTLDAVANHITGVDHGGENTAFFTFIDDAALLPLALIDFQVAPVNNSYIATGWKVDKEEDVDHYTLERSTDGITFDDITELGATGSSDYTFNDLNVVPNQTYYYRLRWTHLDGSIGYSPVRTARLYTGDVWNIGPFYPSPTMGSTNIDVEAPHDATVDVLVFNQLGQQVAAFAGELLGKGKNTLSFDLSGLSHGSYVFQFKSDEWRAVRPIIKLR